MNRYFYDLHLHSCLSPCGDNDMTPNNIIGMGVLNGLDVMALTDHNTSKNCPAFFGAAKKNGIIPIAGMELTTAEDIHVVCLFPTLESAMEFDAYVETVRTKVPNKPGIFGDQLIMDEDDNIVGSDAYVLSFATSVTFDESFDLVKSYGGFAYPAHIDREANGVIAVLGDLPAAAGFSYAEFRDGANIAPYRQKYPVLKDMGTVISSDAHYLWNVNEKTHFFELDDEPYSSKKVTESLFRMFTVGGAG